jgi:hypothetical protein
MASLPKEGPAQGKARFYELVFASYRRDAPASRAGVKSATQRSEEF